MRQARIKVAAESGEAVYHCFSRSVNGEWLFDEPAREVLRRQRWRSAISKLNSIPPEHEHPGELRTCAI